MRIRIGFAIVKVDYLLLKFYLTANYGLEFNTQFFNHRAY